MNNKANKWKTNLEKVKMVSKWNGNYENKSIIVNWKWQEIFFNKWQINIMNENTYGTMKVSKHRGMEVWKYVCK